MRNSMFRTQIVIAASVVMALLSNSSDSRAMNDELDFIPPDLKSLSIAEKDFYLSYGDAYATSYQIYDRCGGAGLGNAFRTFIRKLVQTCSLSNSLQTRMTNEFNIEDATFSADLKEYLKRFGSLPPPDGGESCEEVLHGEEKQQVFEKIKRYEKGEHDASNAPDICLKK